MISNTLWFGLGRRLTAGGVFRRHATGAFKEIIGGLKAAAKNLGLANASGETMGQTPEFADARGEICGRIFPV